MYWRGSKFEFLCVCIALVLATPAGGEVRLVLPDLDLLAGGEVNALGVQGDGKVIAGGKFTRAGKIARKNLARFNTNGSPDLTWEPVISSPSAPQPDVNALAIVGGHVFVGGKSNFTPDLSKLDLVTGQEDAAWSVTLDGSQPEVKALAVSDDGAWLFVAGKFDTVNGTSRTGLAKISTSSPAVVDASWDPSLTFGSVIDVLDIAIDGTSLYACGNFTQADGTARSGVAKFSTEGSGDLDITWNPAPDVYPRSVAATAGSVYLGGMFDNVNGTGRQRVAKVDGSGTGALDLSWDPLITASSGSGYARELRPVGEHLYIGGNFTFTFDGITQRRLARVDLAGTGTHDSSWDPGVSDRVHAISDAGGSAIVAGGVFTFAQDRAALAIARIDTVTADRDFSFAASIGKEGSVDALVHLDDGKLILGGNFVYSGDLERQGVLKLNADYTLDQAWFQPTRGAVDELAIDGDRLYILGRFLDSAGVSNSELRRYSTSAEESRDLAWDPQIFSFLKPSNPADTRLAIDSAGRVYVTDVLTLQPNRGVIRILPDSTIDTWGPAGGRGAGPLALTPDGSTLYIGGDFTEIGGVTQSYLARIDVATGAVDATWTPTLNAKVFDLTIAPDGGSLYVSGLFTTLDGVDTKYLARFDVPSGASVAGWGSQDIISNGSYDKVRVDPDGMFVYAGGNGNLLRFQTSDASRDITFPLGNGYAREIEFAFGGAVLGGGGKGFAVFEDEPGAPLITYDDVAQRLFLSPPEGSSFSITHFEISTLSGAELARPNGVPLVAGEFITVAEGATGLGVVEIQSPPASIEAFSSTSNSPADAGSFAGTLQFGQGSPPAPTIVQFDEASVEVGEEIGAVALSVTKAGPGAGSLSFRLLEGTATKGAGGDYTDTTGTLVFGASDTTKEITVSISDDAPAEPNEVFFVEFFDPTGDIQLAAPARAAVLIRDNDVFGTSGSDTNLILPTSAAPPAATGTLTVDILPAGSMGQWRLIGESFWRNGGTSVSGLAQGNFEIEFRQVGGFLAPPREVIAILAGASETISADYTADGSVGTGSLRVSLKPSSLADGGWKIQGETSWRESGKIAEGLNAGIHIVEFKTVAGWAAPSLYSARVSAGQINTVSGNYLLDDTTSGSPMTPIDITDIPVSPHVFNGQIQTAVGFSSGTAVKEGVVLTVAHAIFDDLSLSVAPQIRWFFQRHKGDYEPQAQIARGAYILGGYAAQRFVDDSPGTSSPESQSGDVATLFFLSPAARGGQSGFLASDNAVNEHLSSASNKVLVGYPFLGVPLSDRGRMHASPEGNFAFSVSHGVVYRTDDIYGRPGASGSSLYVDSGGTYFPAAIYLGGTNRSLFRAIDGEVVSIINRADSSSKGDGNGAGSGPDNQLRAAQTQDTFGGEGLEEDAQVDGSSQGAGKGSIGIILNTSRGGWRLKEYDEAGTFRLGGSTARVPAGGFTVEFKPAAGLVSPSPLAVQVYEDHSGTTFADYGGVGLNYEEWRESTLTTNQILDFSTSAPGADPDGDTINNLLEFAFGLDAFVPDVAGLPTASIADNGNGPRITVTFKRRKASTAPEILYVPQFSSSLGDSGWMPGTIVSVTDLGGDFEEVVAEDPRTASANSRRFGRVFVTNE